MGRRKHKKSNRDGRVTVLLLSTLLTEAWRSLSPAAQCIYPWLKLEWRGREFNNNGKLSISYRQLAKRTGIKSLDTIGRAFRELQRKGFVVIHEIAHLGMEGHGKAFQFELTEIAMPGIGDDGKPHRPRKLFEKWKPGHDFTVVRATSNNPTGRSNKKNPSQKSG